MVELFAVYEVLLVITVVVASVLAVRAWRNRHMPAALPFFWWMVAVVFWAGSTALSTLGGSEAWAFFWMYRVRYLGIAFVPVAVFAFAAAYTGRLHWLERRRFWPLLVIPLLTQIVIWSPLNRTFGTEGLFYETGPFIVGYDLVAGPWYWIHVIYSYGLLTVDTILITLSIFSGFYGFRWRALVLAIGTILPLVATIVATFRPFNLPGLDWTAVSFAWVGLVWSWAVFRHRLLDIIPVARSQVIEIIDDGVIVLDSAETIAELNPTAESILGLDNAQVVGQPVAQVLAVYPELAGQPDGSRYETTLTTARGERRYELRILPIRRRANRVLGRLVVLHEVTTRHELEQQRIQLAVERQQMDVLQKFVRHVSHDLKTPLAIMNTSLYLLEQEFGKHPHHDALQMQINRLTQLIQDMLAMVRLDSMQILEREPADLNALVAEVVGSMEARANANQLKMQFRRAPSLPEIPLNVDEFELALHNLISNAIRYTPAQGEITVTTSATSKGRLSVSVQDTGIGIDPEDLPHIFERNYRGDKARGLNDGSSGLGLSIVRRVIELHGGEIQVESSVGEGSTFRVFLPMRTPLD